MDRDTSGETRKIEQDESATYCEKLRLEIQRCRIHLEGQVEFRRRLRYMISELMGKPDNWEQTPEGYCEWLLLLYTGVADCTHHYNNSIINGEFAVIIEKILERFGISFCETSI